MFDFNAGIGNQTKVGHSIENVLERLRRIVVCCTNFDARLDQVLWYLVGVSRYENEPVRWEQFGKVLVDTRAQLAGSREDCNLFHVELMVGQAACVGMAFALQD
jgi:hypothetical protein